MAEEVWARVEADGSATDDEEAYPVASLLTGRKTDLDGFPRDASAALRATGIAELVENESFFCELHMMFTGMLQNLGQVLGGIEARSAPVETTKYLRQLSPQSSTRVTDQNQKANGSASGKDDLSSSTYAHSQVAEAFQPGLGTRPATLCSPAMTPRRPQVAV